MRLERIQALLREKEIPFQYVEENNCGSINFIHKGLPYHVWEYPAPERGAQSNVRTAGRSEDFEEDYEEQILRLVELL